MKANDYQDWTEKTAIYPKNAGLAYTIIGLASEVGEVAGKFKKCLRDDNGVLTEERKQQLLDELGDVMWYVVRIAAELNVPIEDVMQRNHDKLKDRLNRDVIKGSGDNR